MSNLTKIALEFNNSINSQDIKKLTSFMTDDHTFIDSANNREEGKEKCVEAWRGFFQTFPDYRNIIKKTFVRGDTVILVGRSECSDKRLKGPAIWTAVIRDDRVSEWRVYDDTTENRQMLNIT